MSTADLVGNDTNGVRGIDDERRAKFKNAGKTNDELRRKRVEENLELRKIKREDTLMKRRNVDLDGLVSSPESPQREQTSELTPDAEVQLCSKNLFEGASGPKMFNSLQRLRKLLSREANPPIDIVLRAGLLPRLVAFLSYDDENVQLEAAWAVTNIASGSSEHTAAVIQAGAVPVLLQLFNTSPSMPVAEQALWGLGNIVGDGPDKRDYLLSLGFTTDIISCMKSKPDIPPSFVKNLAWIISNLTRGRSPPPDYQTVKRFLPVLSYMLDYNNVETVVDALWSLSYLSDGPNDQVQGVVDAGIVPKVVRIMKVANDPRLMTPCVRVIGNVVTGTDEQTDAALKAGALDAVGHALNSTKSTLVKEACWLISNIAAGTPEQLKKIFEANVLPVVRAVMQHGEYKCQKEATWVIANIMMGGTPKMLEVLINEHYIEPFVAMLKGTDAKLVVMLLDALATGLQVAARSGFDEKFKLIVEECGGLDTLELLQNHENEDVYNKAHHILENFFCDEGEDAVEIEGAAGDGKFDF
ncbi:unnamed protein product [Notodromas monacha]|uniref:Importin subunit alpha n=1 Tax=Notodromas monacha TaxID=399045 RepID=A0A7R9GDJ0_9CRUS|nr:unnamed protein product [Notodromas monacha]CAG0917011.1 unnamed protein product [Notodromas monacha]